nr:MAG TPA: hypothetical protein [Caudoviricetes sp.]
MSTSASCGFTPNVFWNCDSVHQYQRELASVLMTTLRKWTPLTLT